MGRRRHYAQRTAFARRGLHTLRMAAIDAEELPASSSRPPAGLIALIDFVVRPGQRVRTPRIRYVPTWVRHPDLTVLPAPPGSASWNRTVSVAGRHKGVRPLKPK